MDVQEAVDMLHKRQCLQGNEVGKLWPHVLDLKKKVEALEKEVKVKKRPIYVNVSEDTAKRLN